jgi:two-component system NtrC family response regulator
MASILIIEDDKALRESIADAVSSFGHHALEADNGQTGLEMAMQEQVDAILLDLRMPRMDGLELLRHLRISGTTTPPAAVLTAYANSANTIEAMRLGAFDHLTKPVGREELKSLISRMLRARRSSRDGHAPAVEDELIGPSAAMRSIAKAIGLVADNDATVLITGETGTGKEVVARAIHRHGKRNSGPFVAVNCAAIPAGLLESELFGHARGAFTGATAERRGAFRDADKGTLLLDEIGDMDLAMQAKILRVLQEHTVTPVGGRPAGVDVRVLAATNKDLSAAAESGRFREDLFYRLNVVPIHLPPLRERLTDILPLAEHFLLQATAPPKHLAADAAARLLSYSWPGNARELKNAIERAAILCRSDTITAADLDFLESSSGLHPAPDFTQGELPAAIARLERHMIMRALQETGGNRSEAARRLGIHRQLLYAKAQKYGIDIDEPSENRTASVAKLDKPG